MAAITILLAEDHRMVREGLKALLSTENDFRIVGDAGDGIEAVRLVEQLSPKVLVTDLVLPGLSGLEVARQVSHRHPATKVVMLSMHSKETYVLEALKNGAVAYVLKDAGAVELIRAIREVLAGRRYLSPPLSEVAIEAYMRRAEATGKLDPYESLSSREREVFQMAAEGNTSVAIAGRLFISPRTVETHRANILRKLGLRTQTELIRFALKRGILTMDDNDTTRPS